MNSFLNKKGYGALLVFMALSVISNASFAQFKVLNKGIAGNNTQNLLARIDKDVISEKPDLVILMAGTNDMVNSRKMIAYDQLEQNYRQIMEKLRANHITIVLMSPPPVDTGYLFLRHDPKSYSEDPNAKIDSLNKLIKKLSEVNNSHFIDLHAVFKAAGSPNRTVSSLTVNEANMGLADGIHPTKEGYELIANTIYTYLQKNRLLRKNRKIICFGDSMTYGSFMKNAGTVEGETYPAALKELLEGTP
ncbi:SGNH/GDSL hydrolase family protein [Pedobacter immunditicola]|uniref:SGNH/GDSL hydrolase family protein n=1 Tax=Pedobacter immunditicola TaxID=3133440 RepID=UPI0030A7F175